MKLLTHILIISVTSLWMNHSGAGELSESTAKVAFSGHFSMQDNNGEKARMRGTNQYLKFYPNQRYIRLFIPLPYAASLTPEIIARVFLHADKTSTSSAFLRDRFKLLEEPAVAHLDRYLQVDGSIAFHCDSSVPCTTHFTEELLEVKKRGIVGEHIIKYDRVDI